MPVSFFIFALEVRKIQANHDSNVVFGHVRKIAKSDYQLRHVCPSVRMEQLGSHEMDFLEIWYLIVFGKNVEEN